MFSHYLQVGQHILVLLNNYGVSAAVYFYATLEVIGIMWIYGKINKDYIINSKINLHEDKFIWFLLIFIKDYEFNQKPFNIKNF